MLGMPLAPLLKFDSSPHKSAVSRKDNQKRQMLLYIVAVRAEQTA